MYDPSKVGKKIGAGGDKQVYRYGDKQVVKFSRFASLGGRQVKNKLKEDYTICRRYFDSYVVEVAEGSSVDDRKYIEIQDYIIGEPMTLRHTSDNSLMRQLLDIIACQQKMLDAGFPPIDLIGNGGLFSPVLSNIFVDSTNRLRIIDALLMEVKTLRTGWATVLLPLKKYAVWRQKRTLAIMLECWSQNEES